MINLYYNPSSGSITSSITVVPDYISSFFPVTTYTDVTLTTTASAYESSGSDFTSTVGTLRTYIKSGSSILASFPTDETNIIYGNIYDPYAITNIDTSSFSTNISFYPNFNTTSSLDKFKIYDNTTSTFISIQSESYNNITIPLTSGNNYTITVSGSGQFYTSSIIIQNLATNETTTYTASNTYLTASFSSSTLQSYNIAALTEVSPGIVLTYSASSFPVSPTSSLDAWNTYLSITASSIVNSGSSVYLLGGNLFDLGSLSIGKDDLQSFSSLNLYKLRNLYLTESKITSFPILDSSTLSVSELSVYNNLISGTIPSYISSSQYLTSFNCGSNQLSGSIQNILDVLPQLSIQTINCSYNNLTGSVPILSGSYRLTDFSCNNNQLSGSISSLNGNYNLYSFNCSNNHLTGGIPSLNDCVSLYSFDVSYNFLTGSIPALYNCPSLTQVSFRDNNLTTYISASGTGYSLPSTLTTFNAISNSLTEEAVDTILRDLDNTGAINGYVYLSGGSNASPSIGGLFYSASLANKGWVVSIN
jgi:hypothetical protein